MSGSVIFVPMCGFEPGFCGIHVRSLGAVLENFREGIPVFVGIYKGNSWNWDNLFDNTMTIDESLTLRARLFGENLNYYIDKTSRMYRPISVCRVANINQSVQGMFELVEDDDKRICHIIVSPKAHEKGKLLGEKLFKNPETFGLPKNAFKSMTLSLADFDGDGDKRILMQSIRDNDINLFNQVVDLNDPVVSHTLFYKTREAYEKNLLKMPK